MCTLQESSAKRKERVVWLSKLKEQDHVAKVEYAMIKPKLSLNQFLIHGINS